MTSSACWDYTFKFAVGDWHVFLFRRNWRSGTEFHRDHRLDRGQRANICSERSVDREGAQLAGRLGINLPLLVYLEAGLSPVKYDPAW